MIVLQSTHQKALDRIQELETALRKTLDAAGKEHQAHNTTRDKYIKALKDHERDIRAYAKALDEAKILIGFLERQPMPKTKAANDAIEFTKDDLRSLIQLCHPDKHNGSQTAVAITQRLNALRG